MKNLLHRYYWAILSVLGLICMGFSFLIGVGEGRADRREPVVLSCSDSVLTQLAIPSATAPLPLTKEGNPVTTPNGASITPPAGSGAYVGSKNGTKYYLPSCKSVKRIKPANLIWFKTAEDAKLQGYTPGRC